MPENKKIQINAFVPPNQGDKKMMDDYVAAGFNAVNMTEDFYNLDENREKYFEVIRFCGSLGLDVYILGNSFGVAGTLQQRDKTLSEKLLQKCNLTEWTWESVLFPEKYPRRKSYYEKYFGKVDFSEYPEIKGINVVDEPPISQLYELKTQTVPWFNEKFHDGKMTWDVNFFPPYVELGTGFGTDEKGEEWEYARCVKFYLSEVLSSVKSNEKFFGMDYYALRTVNGEKIIESGYLKAELENAIFAYKYGVEPSAFIQVFSGYSNWRQPCNLGEVRLQMYLNLALGAKKITYYSYCGGYNSEIGVVNRDLNNEFQKSKVYDYIKPVNNEINKFTNIYASFHFEKINFYNGKRGAGQCEAFEKIKNYVSEIENVCGVTCEYDAFITQLRDDKNKLGYMIVNYDLPFLERNNDVSVNVGGEYEKFLCISGGEKFYCKVNNGNVNLCLSAGAGALLIPTKKRSIDEN